jgi:hypothetical protein
MESKRIFIATLFFSFYLSFCYSQTTQKQMLSECQNELKTYEYIFEGTVIKQSKDGKWMCSVVQINSIYKGSPQIKLGRIKVVTELGWEDAPPIIQKGSKYIVFGRGIKLNLQSDTGLSINNSLTLECIDHIDFKNSSASWGWRHPIIYQSLDSLYSFFKANGVTLQEEAPKSDGTKH